MNHPITCECGQLQGYVVPGGTCSRVLCYCKDCQAFAYYLNRQDTVLNVQGGTHLVQLSPHRVVFIQGQQQLASIRLSPNGLIRWFASCCNTPVGNTLSTPNVAFVGLVDNILNTAAIPNDFPGKMAVVHTDSAQGTPKPTPKGLPGTVWRFTKLAVKGRFSKHHQQSPFFNDAGQPIVEPHVLDHTQRQALLPYRH